MVEKVIGAILTFVTVFVSILIYAAGSAGITLVFAYIVRNYTKAFWIVSASIAAAGALFIVCLYCSDDSHDYKPEENGKNS